MRAYSEASASIASADDWTREDVVNKFSGADGEAIRGTI